MDPLGRDELSEWECEAALDRLFPLGPGGEDVSAQLAPEGWARSPLLAVFHPSVEQVYREWRRVHRNLAALGRRDTALPEAPEPTLESVRASWEERPAEADREVRELVAMCLWDVFSDNHDVVAPDGRVVHLGSFRGSAGLLAEWLNRRAGETAYDYMDFYLGSLMVHGRADLTPVYRMIFQRLAAHGFDWEYAFPRIHLVDLRPLREELARAGGPEAGASWEEEAEREPERAQLEETLETAHREAIEAAKDRPPPETVCAYRQVFGDCPRGWPPWD